MTVFSTVSDANLLAYKHNGRKSEIIAKKQEILDSLSLYYNLTPTKTVFNP